MLGPGGAGVSTVATAVAVGDAAGQCPAGDTLLITLDRFRSTSRTLGVDATAGVPVPVSRGVHLLELDTLAMLGQGWAVLRGPVALAGGIAADVAAIDPDELGGVPGIEEMLAWRRIRDEVVSGRWGRVVVDCSGGIDPVAFLGVPGLVATWLERIWPRHRRLVGAAETPRIAGGAGVVEALAEECGDIAGLLADETVTRAHVVAPAGGRGRELTHRLLAVLDLMGIATASVIVNGGRDDGGDPVPPHRVPALPVTSCPELATEPRTIDEFRRLGIRVSDGPSPPAGSAAAEVALVSGSGLESVYRFSWRQLLPDPDTLTMGRSGDDLLVTLSGVRHRVPLPSVLRRCSVLDAQWDDGVISVRFVPDPAVWPRADRSDD